MRRALGLGSLLAVLFPAGGNAAAEPRTPIRHVISVMQENHSFDNSFGTYPGADGVPDDACMPRDPARPSRGCVAPFHIGNRPVEDLSDTPQVAAAQRNRGAMDGFLSAIAQQRGREQPLVMGHYDQRELPFYWRLADEYVLFDRFFGSAAGGTLTNHMFWATGGPGDQTVRESVPVGGFTTPTIFDRLEAKGVSWKFYVQDYDPAITFRSRQPGRVGAAAELRALRGRPGAVLAHRADGRVPAGPGARQPSRRFLRRPAGRPRASTRVAEAWADDRRHDGERPDAEPVLDVVRVPAHL
jgi:phospholipase C